MKKPLPKLAALAALTALALCLPGCFLLPQEEELPTLPLITGEEPQAYEYAQVTRGDLIHDETLTFQVTACQEENLSYTVTGERIKTVYVAVGDTVRAGDLICELAADDADRLTQQYAAEKAQVETDLTYARQDLALCQGASSLAEQERSYAVQVQTLEDRLTVLELRLSEQEAQREAGRLYCTIDGVVTYAKASGSTSIRNTTVVTIQTQAASEYYCDTEFFAQLPVETQVELVVGEVAYQARVTGQSQVPESTRPGQAAQSGDTPQVRVSIQVTDSRAELIDPNLRGTVTLRIDSREDVLLLPSRAVVYAGSQAMVYLEEEPSGLMQVQNITVGLQVDDQIEITGGLSQGDCVILD